MTKTLREAESNGVRCRWNPDEYPRCAQVFETGAWCSATDEQLLDHGATFASLREKPYAPEPSPFDAACAAIKNCFGDCIDALNNYHGDNAKRVVVDDKIMALCVKIRPLVIASTPTDDLVGELVKRGATLRDAVEVFHQKPDRVEKRQVLVLPPEPTR